ncbi:MAG: hypothetical protein M3Y68_06375 [Chloroflexota bacterium]|nr:hypothetical protein [Chloroflexota bacterium]
MATLIDELHTYLFDGQPHVLSGPMKGWLTSSRRFKTFAGAFRDKIRKKLRVAQDIETLHDLRLELETAYLLLRERSLSLDYEPEHSRQIRSPDFAVTFTTSLTFWVEVTRLRSGRGADSSPAASSESERLTDAICSKLGQLQPQQSNVLIVGMDNPILNQDELHSVMLRFQQRAERNDDAFWQRYNFRDRTDFFARFQRLSEILIRGAQWDLQVPPAVWVNPQAKHRLPGKVRSALHRSHSV